MTYNKAGELLTTTDPGRCRHPVRVRPARPPGPRSATALGRTVPRRLRRLGRVGRRVRPRRRTARRCARRAYNYDPAGNVVDATNAIAAGKTSTITYDYDAANRLIRQVEPVADGRSITTSFGYDAAGNRTRYTDGRSNSTVYTVNSLGLPESVIEPATPAHPAAADRTWTVAYDIAGNAGALRAPGGVTRQRTYDAAGPADRRDRQRRRGAVPATAARHLDYDLADRLVAVNAAGGNEHLRLRRPGQRCSPPPGPVGRGELRLQRRRSAHHPHRRRRHRPVSATRTAGCPP